MNGFYGRILIIDLGGRSFTIESPPDEMYRAYGGGKGLAAALLYKYNPPGVDPLDGRNVLIFATGPVTGSSLWGGSRFGVYTKSPLTGFFSESYSGGKVPEAVDAAGFDAVVLRGASAEPVALVITPGGAAFHDARDLWGKETYATEDEALSRFAAKDTTYRKTGAIVIGPAAENGVRFAVIENDYWRSAGRTGPGTVMGAKRVKAIVFQGDRARPPADKEGLDGFSKQIARTFKDHPIAQSYKSEGTTRQVRVTNEAGVFPTGYWKETRAAHWREISAEALHGRNEVKPRACAKCFMACGRMTTVRHGRHQGLRVEGPEYETIYAFGGLCMVESVEEVAFLNDLCDRLGMDTITAGNLCGFAIEAARLKKINFDIDYNAVDAIAGLLGMIARREGIGDVLADGIVRASRAWGMEDVAVHVKGLEPAGFDPRVLKGMGLAYAVADRGACHLRSTFYKPELGGIIPPGQIEDKAALFIDYEDRLTLFDTMILCRFYRDIYPWEDLARVFRFTTGFEFDKSALQEAAARVSDLVRHFNIREGLTPGDDVLPKRLYNEKLADGSGITEGELLAMRRDYYRLRGWDGEGRPRGKPDVY